MSNAINLGAVAYAIRVNLEGTKPETISSMARAMEQLARAGKDLPGVFKQIDAAIGQGPLSKFLDQFAAQIAKLDFSQLRAAIEQINRFNASLGQLPAPLQQAGTGVAAAGQKIQQFADTTHHAASTVRTDSQQMATSLGTAAQAADTYSASLEKIRKGLGALARAEATRSISQSAAAGDALNIVGRRTGYTEQQRALQEQQRVLQAQDAKIRKGLGALAREEAARTASRSGIAGDAMDMVGRRSGYASEHALQEKIRRGQRALVGEEYVQSIAQSGSDSAALNMLGRRGIAEEKQRAAAMEESARAAANLVAKVRDNVREGDAYRNMLSRVVPYLDQFAQRQLNASSSLHDLTQRLFDGQRAFMQYRRSLQEAYQLDLQVRAYNVAKGKSGGPAQAFATENFASAIEAQKEQYKRQLRAKEQLKAYAGTSSFEQLDAKIQAEALKEYNKELDSNAAKTKGASDGIHQYASAITAIGYALSASGLERVSAWLGDAAVSATILAGRVENLETVMHNVGANVGYSSGEMDAMETRIESLGITTQKARESLTLLARNELDLSKSGQLARLAQDAAVIAGENSSEAFEKIVIAIQRLDTRLLRNRGIMINLRQLYQQHAIETGRVETTLTAQEKQQILLNAVLEKGAQIYGTYEAAMGDAHKQFTSLERYIEQARVKLGEQFQPIFAQFVETATQALQAFEKSDWAPQLVGGLTATGLSMSKLTQWTLQGSSAVLSYMFVVNQSKGAVAEMTEALAKCGKATLAQRAAWLAMLPVMHPGPFLAISAAVAAVAGTMVYLSAQAEAQRLKFEKSKKEAVEYVDRLVDMKDAVGQIEFLASGIDRTASSHERLNSQMTELLALAGPYSDALRKVWATTGDAAQVVSMAKTLDPMLTKTDAELSAHYAAQAEKARTAIQAYRQQLLDAESPGEYGGAGGYNDASSRLTRAGAIAEAGKERFQEAEKQLAQAEAYQDKITAKRERDLKVLSDRQDVAVGLALRAESQLQQQREKLYDDANLQILDNLLEFKDKLRAEVATIGELDELARSSALLQLRQKRSDIDAQIDKARKDGDTERERDLELGLEQARLQILSDMRNTLLQQLSDREKILQNQQASFEIARLQLQTEERQLRNRRELSDLSARFDSSGPSYPEGKVGTEEYENSKRAVEQHRARKEQALRFLEAQQKIRAEEERIASVRENVRKKVYGDADRASMLREQLREAENNFSVAKQQNQSAQKELSDYNDAVGRESIPESMQEEFDNLSRTAFVTLGRLQSMRGQSGVDPAEISKAREEYDAARKALDDFRVANRKLGPEAEEHLHRLQEAADTAAGRMQALSAHAQKLRVDLEEATNGLAGQVELLEEKLRKLEAAAAMGDAESQKQISETRQKLGEATQLRAEQLANEAAAERKSVQEKHDREQEKIKIIEDSIKEQLDKQETLIDRIRDLEQDQTAYTATEARKRLEERRKEFEAVGDFIRKERLSLLDDQVGGVESAAKVYQDYADQAMKASTPQQLAWLRKLSQERFAGILRDVSKEVSKAQQEFTSAKTPQDRQSAIQRIQTANMQYMKLAPYVRKFEQQLQGDFDKRGNALSGVAQERQNEITLVENTVLLAKEELGVLEDQVAMHERKVQVMRQELLLKEKSAAWSSVQQAQQVVEAARLAHMRVGTPQTLAALRAATEQMAIAQQNLALATERMAQGVPAPAPRQGNAVAHVGGAGVQRQGAPLNAAAPLPPKPEIRVGADLPRAQQRVAELERQQAALPEDQRAGIKPELDRARRWRDSLQRQKQERELQEDMFDLPPERGMFATGAAGTRQYLSQYGRWANRNPTGRISSGPGGAGLQERWNQARQAQFAEEWQNAGSWAERNEIMRRYRRWGANDARRFRGFNFQEEKKDRAWAFQNFGPNMRNQFPQIPVNPPAQLPNAQEGLIEAPLNQQERANAEMDRAVGQVGRAMDQLVAGFEAQIETARQLAEHAQRTQQGHQQNVADAERVIGMLQQLA